MAPSGSRLRWRRSRACFYNPAIVCVYRTVLAAMIDGPDRQLRRLSALGTGSCLMANASSCGGVLSSFLSPFARRLVLFQAGGGGAGGPGGLVALRVRRRRREAQGQRLLSQQQVPGLGPAKEDEVRRTNETNNETGRGGGEVSPSRQNHVRGSVFFFSCASPVFRVAVPGSTQTRPACLW